MEWKYLWFGLAAGLVVGYYKAGMPAGGMMRRGG